MLRLLVLVEGHGETEAVANLITRLHADRALPRAPVVPLVRRWPALESARGLARAAQYARRERNVDALLVFRDLDDGCPADVGPRDSARLLQQGLPFPAAVVLIRREYESLFLASLGSIAGRPLGSGATLRQAVASDAQFEDSAESVRGAKEWLSRHYPPGRRYKPTTDQLDLTRNIDFDLVRGHGHDSFGVLERALTWVCSAAAGDTYPPRVQERPQTEK